jgi:hypothetical protein
MASKPACHTGHIVLLRAGIIGFESEGPYVRVETDSGGAACFSAPIAAVVQIEGAVDASKGTTPGTRRNLTTDQINLARESWGDWQP